MQSDSRPYAWVKSEGQKRLATENLVPGNRVYKERLVSARGTEYRVWDATRSKLAAAIANGLEAFPFGEGAKVLYLGASTGTTASHVSDMVGPGGAVFGVEHASRVAREFLERVASFRENVIPIMQDARRPAEYFSIYGKVDIVYADIAQPDQTDIAIANCKMYLKAGGHFFLVIKTRSIDVTKSPKSVISAEAAKLRGTFELLETIDLDPYHKDHALAVSRMLP